MKTPHKAGQIKQIQSETEKSSVEKFSQVERGFSQGFSQGIKKTPGVETGGRRVRRERRFQREKRITIEI